ncbi:MAG: ATP synthase subunit C [Oscillospiraceae bacterium]|jgi:V/A-type H+-transporting ATPase subunit K|nr:ATP synthase subunit C [Oscillospiraceae bacterium]
MDYLLILIPVAMLVSPLYAIYRRRAGGKGAKTALLCQICVFFGAVLLTGLVGANNALAADAETAAASGITDMSWGLIAAALATGLSGIGGGLATAAAASAALGAISENEKLFGKAMLFVGLAEGIALYGLIVSLMILGRF